MKITAKQKKLFAEYSLLYVEDDNDISKMNDEVLAKFFKQVDVAANGQIGLKLFQENTYDIVISDIQMPVMSGLELSENIKKMKPEQPIIITSAHDDSLSLMRLIKTGVSNFILKPFSAMELLEVLLPIVQSLRNIRELADYKLNLENMVEEKSREISKQNLFLKNIIKSQKIPFIVVDMQSYLITDSNDEALAQDQIGKINIHQFLCNQKDDCQGKNYPCSIKLALEKKEPSSFEKVMNYKNLGPRFVRVETFPVINEFGEVEKILAYLVDVTADSQKDITRIAVEGKLKLQLSHQTLVADLAKILNSAANFQLILKSAIFFLGNSLNIPKVAVFRLIKAKNRLDLLEEVTISDEGSQILYLDRICFDGMNQKNVDKLMDGASLAFSDLSKMTQVEKDVFEKHKIGSLLLLPIVIDEVTVGILAFFHHHEHFWNYKNYALYAAITHLLANTWARSN